MHNKCQHVWFTPQHIPTPAQFAHSVIIKHPIRMENVRDFLHFAHHIFYFYKFQLSLHQHFTAFVPNRLVKMKKKEEEEKTANFVWCKQIDEVKKQKPLQIF